MSKRSHSGSNKENVGEKKKVLNLKGSSSKLRAGDIRCYFAPAFTAKTLIASIFIHRIPKQLVENGLNATSKEIGASLSSIRLVCKGWREAVDDSIPWTAAKFCHDRYSGKGKPFLIRALDYCQLKLFDWAMEHLSKEVPIKIDFLIFFRVFSMTLIFTGLALLPNLVGL